MRIFKVIEKQTEIKEFEKWLYSEETLVDQMDNELILELYSFNYNQRGVDYEFSKLFLSFFDEKEFIDWKIIANLETLSERCNTPERILGDFYDLIDVYSFLTSVGYHPYELEDCEYFGRSRSEMIAEIQNEAKQLLLEIQEWLLTSSNKDLRYFVPKPKKTEATPYHVPMNVIIPEISTTRWWEFWK